MKDKKIRSDYWMQTYSTGRYDYVHNYPEDINIIDIANALAGIPRFLAHTKVIISVAQHSLHVAAALEKDGFNKKTCLVGLMHDAHEAYTGDLISPMIAHMIDNLGFDMSRLFNPIKKAIGTKFGIDIINLPKRVHTYDYALLRTEAESLFPRCIDDWAKKASDHKGKMKVKNQLTRQQASEMFITAFKHYGGKL